VPFINLKSHIYQLRQNQARESDRDDIVQIAFKKDDGKEKPVDEMDKLEDEDSIRVEHLKGDDAIFGDLGLSSKEYPKMQTTW